jgi:hypothetical protein
MEKERKEKVFIMLPFKSKINTIISKFKDKKKFKVETTDK